MCFFSGSIEFCLNSKHNTSIKKIKKLKEYHLHKGDYSKLQLDIQVAIPYCQKNIQHCYNAHRHSFYQIIWFKKAGIHFVDYKKYNHPQNSIYFLNIGQVHYFCKESDNDGFLFHFNDILFNKQEKDAMHQFQYSLFNELGKPFVAFSEDEIANFEYFTEKLKYEIKEKPFKYKQQIYYYLQIMLLQIERKRQEENNRVLVDRHFDMAIEFKSAIDAHKGEFKSVDYFSQLLGVSEKTLNAISKKYFKDTPANIIHQRKILEAKRLLSNAKLTIKEIAYELGFKQPTYFTKYFKKYTGLTPKQFQRQLL